MAETQRDLTYPCSKIIMEPMRANHRYLLAACCPDLRTIHTKAPLKINELILDTNGFIIDLVQHFFQTYVSNLDQIPCDWRVMVPPGGLHYDIDRFGHRYEADAIEGDIAISQWLVDYHAHDINVPADEWTPAPSDVYRERMRRAMRQREKTRVRRARGRVRVQTYLQYTRYTPAEYPRGAWGPFRNNNYLLYSRQTQVRYPRGIQLAEAVRKLMGNFLAPREIIVNRLEFDCSFGILRLPRDLRFHVATLKTWRLSVEVLNAITPINMGLQTLAITVERQDDPILNHQILRRINTLTIRFVDCDDWPDVLCRIEVPIVEVLQIQYTPDDLAILGQHWLDSPKPVGRKMMYEMEEVRTLFDDVLEMLAARKGTCPSVNMPPEYPHCGFRNVDLDTDFVIYVTKEKHPDGETFWYLIFEVMNVGRAMALEEEED